MRFRFFIPAVMLLLAIVMTILYFCDLKFIYYLAGGIVGIITHMLMMLQSKSMYNTISTDIGKATYHPRKSSILWYLLRLVIAVGAIVGICYFANIRTNPNKLQITIMIVCGYLTVKVSFILYLLKFERG